MSAFLYSIVFPSTRGASLETLLMVDMHGAQTKKALSQKQRSFLFVKSKTSPYCGRRKTIARARVSHFFQHAVIFYHEHSFFLQTSLSPSLMNCVREEYTNVWFGLLQTPNWRLFLAESSEKNVSTVMTCLNGIMTCKYRRGGSKKKNLQDKNFLPPSKRQLGRVVSKCCHWWGNSTEYKKWKR